MKFVCERCHTKYSIADDKVRGKVLKVRCKTCANVITVRETGASIDNDATVIGEAPTAPRTSATHVAASSPSSTQHRGGAGLAHAAEVSPPARPLASARLVHAALPQAALSDRASPAVPPPRRPTASLPRPTAPVDDVEWFLAVDGAQTGPFTRSTLLERILSAPKAADVHVWNADLDGWKPPRELSELAAELTRRRRSLTPVPPPPPRRTFPGAPREPAPASRDLAGDTQIAAAPALSSRGGSVSAVRPLPQAVSDLPPLQAPAPGHAVDPALNHGPSNGAPSSNHGSNHVSNKNGAASGAGFDAALGGAHAAVTAEPVTASAAPAVVAPVSTLVEPTLTIHPEGGIRTPAPLATGTHVVKGRPTKLIAGGVALALAVCALVAVTVLRKPAKVTPRADTAAVVADKTRTSGADFAGLAEKLAKEESAQAASAAAAIAAPATPAPPPSIAHVEAPTLKTGRRTKRGRSQAILSTTPPPIGQSAANPSVNPGAMTSQQREAAGRFGDGSQGREIRVQPAASTAARSTPIQGDISRVINNNRQGIQTCYQRALLRDNSLTSGKITVRVTIGLSGRVQKVNLDASPPFRALEPCIRDVMSRWAFPPSSEEYQTEFPVVLAGNQ